MQLGALVLTGVLIAADAGAVSFPGRVPNDQDVPSLAPMLEQVMPAVVGVATFSAERSTERARNALIEDPFFGRFFDVPEQSTYAQDAARWVGGDRQCASGLSLATAT